MLAMQREMEMLASKMLLDWPEASVALANLKMKVVHIECVEGDSGSHEGRRRVCSDLANQCCCRVVLKLLSQFCRSLLKPGTERNGTMAERSVPYYFAY